jgi:hypothetical protein
MSSRRSLSSVVVVASMLALSAIALAGHRATPRTSDPVQVNAQHLAAASSGQPGSNWVFEGCWGYFAAGPCYDIYRDSSGNYWKCAKCGTTKNPRPGSCSQISQQTLNSGYWCS